MNSPCSRLLTLRLEANEVPEIIVCGLPLRYLIVRLGFYSMDEVRKLDGILNEEDWNVVPDNVPDTLLGVELGGEATNITNSILSRCHQLHERCMPGNGLLTAEPREPWTAEKRTKVGVVREGSVSTGA